MQVNNSNDLNLAEINVGGEINSSTVENTKDITDLNVENPGISQDNNQGLIENLNNSQENQENQLGFIGSQGLAKYSNPYQSDIYSHPSVKQKADKRIEYIKEKRNSRELLNVPKPINNHSHSSSKNNVSSAEHSKRNSTASYTKASPPLPSLPTTYNTTPPLPLPNSQISTSTATTATQDHRHSKQNLNRISQSNSRKSLNSVNKTPDYSNIQPVYVINNNQNLTNNSNSQVITSPKKVNNLDNMNSNNPYAENLGYIPNSASIQVNDDENSNHIESDISDENKNKKGRASKAFLLPNGRKKSEDTEKSIKPPRKHMRCCLCCPCYVCVIITVIILVAIGLLAYFLWPDMPDVDIGEVKLNSKSNDPVRYTLPSFTDGSGGLEIDLGIDVSVNNPNSFDLNISSLDIQVFLSDNSVDKTLIGTGKINDLSFKKKEVTKIEIPITIGYYVDSVLTDPVISYLLTKCATQTNINIEYTVGVGIKFIKLFYTPKYTGTNKFKCPLNSIGQLLFSSQSLLDLIN